MTIAGTLTVTGTFTWKNERERHLRQHRGARRRGRREPRRDRQPVSHARRRRRTRRSRTPRAAAGGQFRTITINKPSGTVSLACNPIVFSTFILTAGTVNTGPIRGWWRRPDLGGARPEPGQCRGRRRQRDGRRHEPAGGEPYLRRPGRQADRPHRHPLGLGQLERRRRRHFHSPTAAPSSSTAPA